MARNAHPTFFAEDMLAKVAQIKRQHAQLSSQVDGVEAEVRRLMEAIRDELDILEIERDRKLLTVYLINLVHKAQDEILAD